MPRRTLRSLAVTAAAAFALGAAPALAHAADDDTDPSAEQGASCTMTDGSTLEDGEEHFEFQANGHVLQLTCDDGTLCGAMYGAQHNVPLSYACESWGDTVERRSEARGARVVGVLVTTRAGSYRIRPVAPRLRTVAKKALPIAG